MKQPQLSHWKTNPSPVWAVVTVRISHQQPAMGFNVWGPKEFAFPLKNRLWSASYCQWWFFITGILALTRMPFNTPKGQWQPGICMPLVLAGTRDFWNMQSDASVHLETLAINGAAKHQYLHDYTVNQMICKYIYIYILCLHQCMNKVSLCKSIHPVERCSKLQLKLTGNYSCCWIYLAFYWYLSVSLSLSLPLSLYMSIHLLLLLFSCIIVFFIYVLPLFIPSSLPFYYFLFCSILFICFFSFLFSSLLLFCFSFIVFIYLFLYSFFYSLYLSLSHSLALSINQSINKSIKQANNLTLTIYLSIHLSIDPSIYLSIHLSNYISPWFYSSKNDGHKKGESWHLRS